MALISLENYSVIDINDKYILREPEASESDAQCLIRTYSNPLVARYIPDDLIPADIQHGKEILEYYKRSKYENRFYWSITKKNNNEMIGLIGFCDINSYNSRVEIAYELNPDYWRQGIMTAVIKNILKIMFEKITIKRIQANVLPDNYPSIRLLQKSGFIYEGMLNSYRMFKGKQRDIAMLGYSSDQYFSDQKKKIINNNPIKFSHIPSHQQILKILKKA